MSEKLNLCILGCGAIARLHARVARTMSSRVHLMFASRSLERALEYNDRYKGVGAFGDYEEACADPRVHAVFICTPHAFHVEHVQLATGHRKHVLIEKPVCRTLAELAQIERAAAEAGVVAMVAENYHFKPLVRTLRYHLGRGDVGDVVFLELNRAGRSKITGWRADAEKMGGGALLEGGVHWVNLFLNLGGDAREVIAAQPSVDRDLVAPFEDGLEVLVKFAGGGVGKLLHSWNTINRIGGLSSSRILGTAGNIHFESNGIVALVLGRRKRLRVPGLLDIMGYRAMLRHFVDCVRDGGLPEMSLTVARRDLRVVTAAYRSLRTGRFESAQEDLDA